jgi:Holliday junction resolvase RusA-like endonuclease
MILSLPIPPSVNNYLRSAGRGRKWFYSKEARAYFDLVPYVKTKMHKAPFNFPIEEDVDVYFTFYFKNERRIDVNNLLKIPCDLLEKAGVVKDDKLIMPQVSRIVVPDMKDDLLVVEIKGRQL